MMVRQCACGGTPRIARGIQAGYVVIQLQCPCGHKGARLLCASPDHVERARQAAVDGWNLAG